MNAFTSKTAPEPESLIQAAHELIPFLRKKGPQHDADKRVSDEVTELLRGKGFFRICQSRENGGYGLRPSVLWRVTREIARGDSATAWILSLAGLHPWMAGMFPPRAQDDVFANGRDAIVVALTGNVGRGVDASFDGADFTLTGKWTYASGIDVADWACVLVELEMDGAREQRLLLVPKASFRIDDSSWNVMGMRGTGSKDVYLDNEKVPLYRSVRWKDLQTIQYPGRERNKDPMYRIPHTSLFAMSVAAAVCAVAYGMLDLYREALRRRTPAGLNTVQTEDRFSLAELGKAASQLDMAFNQLMHDVDELYDRGAAGHDFVAADRAKYRANAATIADATMAAVNVMVRNIGGSLLPNGPIERCFRDLHSMASHFLLQTNPAAELFGRALLGLELPPTARI
ncbi:hypothetical protein [Parapusillimonas granuli]|uniref:Acyl-CoA dehydrogenase C-terminal domain-containing protein n=1 Tax=Parapusillimonas granuli TaxID=380911 RepID=A0A853FWM6_9BURK|nr:hypothetical protein [Parapusillimonas granuli]MBB5214589.1 3-hydroxy-9,10-secoandrosta-1,3,5(10)-triene-9,17-dione monooxygenase [Parapusillimonas granuli]NYT49003.1 hypothetical protein [Parapusillimonas granuli]